jgi:hypothetical protein
MVMIVEMTVETIDKMIDKIGERTAADNRGHC